MLSVELQNLHQILDSINSTVGNPVIPGYSKLAADLSATIKQAVMNYTLDDGVFAYETNGAYL